MAGVLFKNNNNNVTFIKMTNHIIESPTLRAGNNVLKVGD